MDALLKFVSEHFCLIFALVMLWSAFSMGSLLWRRKRKGLILPKVSDPDVVFSEQFASGSSDKTWISRRGSASNCLTVIVTKTHLAITTFFPLTAFAEISDLEHLVPFSDISKVSTNGNVTHVEFRCSNGDLRKVTLWMRNTAEFIRALRDQNNCKEE